MGSNRYDHPQNLEESLATLPGWMSATMPGFANAVDQITLFKLVYCLQKYLSVHKVQR